MSATLSEIGQTFVALFAVANALPIVPVLAGATEQLEPTARRTVLNQALVTGLLVGLVIVVTGPAFFGLIGITIDDLRIAGGVVLLVFAVHDLLFSREHRKEPLSHNPGPVPLGVPLLVGPATMATLLVLSQGHGALLVAGVFVVNVAVNWLVVHQGVRLIGNPKRVVWTRAIGKVFGLILAAIAVSMIRLGVVGALA